MEDHRKADRRISIIASHFAAAEEEIASPHRIFLANCSSSLNSVIRRCDNRALFARQGSASQAPFMRQVSLQENSWHGNLHQENLPGMSSGCENEKYSYALPGAPLFSRPAQADSNILNVGDCQPEKQVCELSAIEPPAFARPGKGTPGQKQHSIKKIRHTAYCNGIGWSPRMDIAESGCGYVVTVDLPGVNMDEIRVEVEDQNLIVTGKRAIQWLRVEKVPVNSNPRYPQREILQGPYQVVWPLPTGVNKDGVSAEFIDGFLQITVRKL